MVSTYPACSERASSATGRALKPVATVHSGKGACCVCAQPAPALQLKNNLHRLSKMELDKVPGTVHEFLASFNKEEGTLLHTWQKELYRTMMKEIHRALLSLGSTIHGTLLRMNGAEKMHILEEQHSDGRPVTLDRTNDTSFYRDVNTDIIFRVKYEEEQDARDDCVPEVSEISNNFNTSASDNSLGIEANEIPNLKNTELTERCESHDFHIPEITVVTPAVKLPVKEEADSFLMDHQACERRGIISTTTDRTKERENSSNHRRTPATVTRSVPVGKLRSWVWQYFDVPHRDDVKTATAVICTICLRNLKRGNSGDSDASFGIIEDEIQLSKNSPTISRSEVSDYLGTVFPFPNTDLCSRKEEPGSISIDHLVVKVGESADPNAGVPVFISAISPSHNRKKEMHFQEKGHNESTPGEGSGIRKRQAGFSSIGTKQARGLEELLEKKAAKDKLRKNSQMANTSRSQLWSDRNQELGEGKTVPHDHSFSIPTHSNVIPETSNIVRSGRYENVTNQWNAKLPKQQSNAQTDLRPYTCTECKKSFKMKYHLNRHNRIHTGERPFICAQCGKSFSLKHHLIGHQRTHWGERPYKCAECKQSFKQKNHFIAHQHKHMGAGTDPTSVGMGWLQYCISKQSKTL